MKLKIPIAFPDNPRYNTLNGQDNRIILLIPSKYGGLFTFDLN